MSSLRQHVLIVGAGPVGVVAALACAQGGFGVTLIEASDRIDESPRAATTHPSTLEMIDKLGLTRPFEAEGLVARYFDFRDQNRHERVARFDHDLLKNDTPFPYVVQTEQHKLVRMGLEKLKEYPDAQVFFNTSLKSLSQDDAGVTAQVESGGDERPIVADYMIASDGGRSTVRKQLGIAFEGMTFPERFIVITVLDDFVELMGTCYRNYLAAPRDWSNLFKVSGDDGKGRWRIVFPSAGEGNDEQDLADAPVFERLQKVFPLGRPYQVVHRNVYRVHQRVAATFRQGRVFLAGDAAHVNNPIGGLGLNSGVHDAMELSEMLIEEAMNGLGTVDFDRYDRRRRRLNIEFVQQQTIANKKRLEEVDPLKRQAALDDLAAMAADPVRHRAFLMRTSLLDSVRQSKAIA